MSSLSQQLSLRRGHVARVVISALQHKLSALRPGSTIPSPREWNEWNSLSHPALALSSAERLQLVAALSEMFHLYETQAEDRLLLSGEICHWVDTIVASQAEFSSRFSFHCPGTGLRSQLFMHETASLFQEVEEWRHILHGRRRIISFVPAHHIFGFLFSVLLPKALNIPIVDANFDDVPPFEYGDLIVSSPQLLPQFASAIRSLPPGVWAASSSGPIRYHDFSTLSAKGLETLVDIYSTSETGGIAYRYHLADSFDLLPYFQSTASGALLRRHPSLPAQTVDTPVPLRWAGERAFFLDSKADLPTPPDPPARSRPSSAETKSFTPRASGPAFSAAIFKDFAFSR